MNNDVDKYKENEKLLSCMNKKEWKEAMEVLKNYKYNSMESYSVKYKQGKQRKERSFHFNDVVFKDETQSFILTRYSKDYLKDTDELDKNNIEATLELKSVDIIKIDCINFNDFKYY